MFQKIKQNVAIRIKVKLLLKVNSLEIICFSFFITNFEQASQETCFHQKISFILSTIFSVTKIPPRRDSAKCQLSRLYTQFSSTKILKPFYIESILEKRSKVLLKMFVIEVKTSFFEHFFKFLFIPLFFQYWLWVNIQIRR